MATTDSAGDKRTAPSVPYISFKTILNLADRLAPEPPPRIDKSVLEYLSSGYRSQVLTTLRALNLTDEHGIPSETLVRMVTHPGERNGIIRSLWHTYYKDILDAFDLSKGTADQLSEAFNRFGIAGDTKIKALIFFVHGAKFAEIPLSARITAGISRAKAAGSRRTKRGRTAEDAPVVPPNRTPAAPTNYEFGRVAVHPMLSGAIVWLSENGESWTEEQADLWCRNFVGSVKLVYPPHPSGSARPLGSPNGLHDGVATRQEVKEREVSTNA